MVAAVYLDKWRGGATPLAKLYPKGLGFPDYRECARGVQAFEETSKDSPLPREGSKVHLARDEARMPSGYGRSH